MFTKNFLPDSNLADDPVFALLESLPEEALLIDPNGMILGANSLFAARFGLSAEECIGAIVYDLIATVLQLPELALHYREKSEDVLCTGQRMVFEDGKEELNWKVTINPVLSPEGTIARLFITIADISEQKQITARLDENKTRFNQALESARTGVWEWNLATNENDWSGEIWHLYGLESSQTTTPSFQLWASLIHPDDLESTINAVTEAAKCETELNVEYRICYPDGSTHWLMARGKPLRDRNGIAVRYIGTIIDITKRKTAEQALASSEKMFRSIAEQIAEIVFITDQYGIINYVSPAVDTISGYTTDEVIGHPFIEFVFEKDIERAVSSFQLGLSGKNSDEMLELRYKKKDGSLFHAEIHVQYYQHQEFIGYIGLIRDISNRKKFEQELIESKEFLKNIYDKVNYSIFVVDVLQDGSYQFKGINPLHETVIGIGSDGVNGKRPEQLFSPACAESVIRHYDDCIRAGHSIQYEEHVLFKGNDSFWETVLNPVRNENGTIFRIIGTSIDITERKQIEEERAELGVQLQQSQKMEMVGRLAGGIAHDFNNMLTVILGHSEMAMEQIDPTLTTYADFDAIHHAATHSANLTRQLLAFARKQVVTPKIVEMNTAITEMLPILRRIIGENITLIWIPECKNCYINIDPTQINQILVNLCINARDAIIGHGSITIENRCLSLPEIASESCETECLSKVYVSLSVHDDGCGIDPNDLQHIFEPFFTTKESGKGTGLGLSTVYGIVKQNNGNIDCLSEQGKGTTVTIHLPKHKVKATTNLDTPQEQLLQKGHQTILLVEDEPGILKLCKLILERNGYTVLTFESAGDAIKMAERYQGTIDLLVTDVMMPEMNGSELSKKLLATRPDLKILFISGYTADVIAHNTILDSRLNFMQKPFNSKALTTIVYNILNSELLQESVVE
jgi:PAS domain S-box-containing protein